jgi:hypothetical protein
MNTVLHNLLSDVPKAVAIWLTLMAIAVVALGAMVGPDDWNRIRHGVRNRKPRKRVRLPAEARELSRYSEEVAVAAERATATAHRRREEWLAAQGAAEEAWRAFDFADAAARRLASAAALPVPRTPRTPTEYADRERYLHRAVMAACTRNELSIWQLSDALAHRNGWDPRRHPVEQETALRRVVRDRFAAAHATAAERERAAWHAAEAAAVAAGSLQGEAIAAAWRARWVRPCLKPEPEAAAEVTQAVRQPPQAVRWRAARTG